MLVILILSYGGLGEGCGRGNELSLHERRSRCRLTLRSDNELPDDKVDGSSK